MPNTTPDWLSYFLICPRCKQEYHASEGGCPCEDDDDGVTPDDVGYDPRDEDPYLDEVDGALADDAAEAHFEDLEQRRERGRE